MLAASATHPAMLTYLNNAESTKDSPNENYGRELLELHSVGVDAGYSEEEMHDSTLMMTGLQRRLGHAASSSTTREYHHTGPREGPGLVVANNAGGERLRRRPRLRRYLAHHPSTARRIADKLVARFVSDDAAARPRGALAQTFLANDTAIVPVLRKLFRSERVRQRRSGEDPPPDAGRGRHRPDPGDGARRERQRRACRGSTGWSRTWATRRWRGRSRTAIPTSPTPGARRAARSAGGTSTCRSPRIGGPTACALPDLRSACCRDSCPRRTASSWTRWRRSSCSER